MDLTLEELGSMVYTKMELNGDSFDVAVSAIERESTIPKRHRSSSVDLRLKLHKVVSRIILGKRYNSLSEDQRVWLNWCVDRASRIMWEDKNLFANAPDAARKALGEMRKQFQKEGIPQASTEHIDLAMRLICSRLGAQRGTERGVRKPEQKRLKLT